MADIVCMGAMCRCSFGSAPSALMVIPEKKNMIGNQVVAGIMDNVPLRNIMPFGMCSSLANPMVVAATAEKLGVQTPMPCMPVIEGPWKPGAATVTLGNKQVLTGDCKLSCAFGGIIEIVDSGSQNVTIEEK